MVTWRSTSSSRCSKPRFVEEWIVALPPGLPLLNLNDRLHWAVRNKKSQVLKEAARIAASGVPALPRISVEVVFEPPDRRRRDADNPVASAKPCIDGLVLAGIIPDDECPRYVEWVKCRIGERYPKGRLVMYVREACECI